MVRTSNDYPQCPGSNPGRGKAENEKSSQLVDTLCQLNDHFLIGFRFYGELSPEKLQYI